MKFIKLVILTLLVFFSFTASAQADEGVEMADVLRRDGKIYTVVIALVIILTAVIILLLRLDRKVKKLEQESAREEN